MAFKHLPQLFYIILFNPKASNLVTYSITNYSIFHFRSAIWLVFIRPFGLISFGHLARFRSVVWRVFVGSFGRLQIFLQERL